MMYLVECKPRYADGDWTGVRAFSDYAEAEKYMWQQSFEYHQWRIL
jgi:hypothetical protein